MADDENVSTTTGTGMVTSSVPASQSFLDTLAQSRAQSPPTLLDKDIRDLAIKTLASDFLNVSDANVALRAYLVETTLPACVLAMEALIKNVLKGNRLESDGTLLPLEPDEKDGKQDNKEKQKDTIDSINWLAQHLYRNNPRFANFTSPTPSPYLTSLTTTTTLLKSRLFDIEATAQAKKRAQEIQKRQEMEREARMEKEKQAERIKVFKELFGTVFKRWCQRLWRVSPGFVYHFEVLEAYKKIFGTDTLQSTPDLLSKLNSLIASLPSLSPTPTSRPSSATSTLSAPKYTLEDYTTTHLSLTSTWTIADLQLFLSKLSAHIDSTGETLKTGFTTSFFSPVIEAPTSDAWIKTISTAIDTFNDEDDTVDVQGVVELWKGFQNELGTKSIAEIEAEYRGFCKMVSSLLGVKTFQGLMAHFRRTLPTNGEGGEGRTFTPPTDVTTTTAAVPASITAGDTVVDITQALTTIFYTLTETTTLTTKSLTILLTPQETFPELSSLTEHIPTSDLTLQEFIEYLSPVFSNLSPEETGRLLTHLRETALSIRLSALFERLSGGKGVIDPTVLSSLLDRIEESNLSAGQELGDLQIQAFDATKEWLQGSTQMDQKEFIQKGTHIFSADPSESITVLSKISKSLDTISAPKTNEEEKYTQTLQTLETLTKDPTQPLETLTKTFLQTIHKILPLEMEISLQHGSQTIYTINTTTPESEPLSNPFILPISTPILNGTFTINNPPPTPFFSQSTEILCRIIQSVVDLNDALVFARDFKVGCGGEVFVCVPGNVFRVLDNVQEKREGDRWARPLGMELVRMGPEDPEWPDLQPPTTTYTSLPPLLLKAPTETFLFPQTPTPLKDLNTLIPTPNNPHLLLPKLRLYGAKTALVSLDARVVRELKSYRRPPAVVKRVVRGVLYLCGVAPAKVKTWHTLLTYLTPALLTTLQTHIPTNTPKPHIRRAKRVLRRLPEDVEARGSLPARVLREWCLGVIEVWEGARKRIDRGGGDDVVVGDVEQVPNNDLEEEEDGEDVDESDDDEVEEGEEGEDLQEDLQEGGQDLDEGTLESRPLDSDQEPLENLTL
ncbi:uncharacterized protein SPPG_04370 [Spizellomyces punctatus DAOM BR117]|uniref:Uncharacterized protein n=1 Tax=Spizellomyces punctatus (strain DAOM BR117) TaxID=645134 RepID=A0A0L0HGT9_SPIPD|nr:uncharacterized protein SPPG_04370 [Spizellomyces punctatus DAOM BR117]KND00024.1 hypothetical protein SPPG_04370 [Spizellomyces punctatus DAOM BR117]|eukprot:XP_016608063.1 hypothetical protein SPPG_04370 [Spizellomyces punctatus DAOM BR117]